MPELNDADLERQVRSVLTERLGAISLGLTLEDLQRRAGARARARAIRRRWIVLGLAAALVLPAGWVAVGAPVPKPTLTSVILPSPSIGPETPNVVPATPLPTPVIANGPYDAIMLRRSAAGGATEADVDVVAIRVDGAERLIGRLRAADMPARLFDGGFQGHASPNGLLALTGGRAQSLALIELHGPVPSVVALLPDTETLAWGPDGRLAFRPAGSPPGTITVVEPGTGTTLRTSLPDKQDGHPLQWAADGSALLIGTGEPVSMTALWKFGWTRRLLTPDSAADPLATGFVPIFDDGRRRDWSVAGDRAVLCPPHVNDRSRCPTDGRYTIGRQDGNLHRDVWDVTPTRGAVFDAVFTAADRGMWLLGDDPDAVLTRVDENGARVRTVRARVAPDAGQSGEITAIAPDDSVALLTFGRDDPDISELLLLPTDGTAGTYHSGEFAGFVPSAVADGLGGGSFSSDGVSTEPAVGHAPDLASAGDLDRYAAMGFGIKLGEPVLLRRAGPAQPGTDVQVELGTVTQRAGHQLVLQVACAGPGTLDVSYLQEGVGADCMADDQSSFGYAIDAPSRDTTVTFSLHTDKGAAWRIAIYDLGP